MLPSCLDRVTSVYLFHLACVVCRRIFKVISKFEEKLEISMTLKLIFI